MKKYIFDTGAIEGLNIAVVDDSCVRADTVQEYFYRIKKGGAKKVKFFIGWPPIIHPCNLGIDTPTLKELFAYKLVLLPVYSKEPFLYILKGFPLLNVITI